MKTYPLTDGSSVFIFFDNRSSILNFFNDFISIHQKLYILNSMETSDVKQETS